MRLLGLLSPLAVRLLQVRALAREDPERPASQVIDPVMLAVLAQRCGGCPSTLTGGAFFAGGGPLGGHLAPSPQGSPFFRTNFERPPFFLTTLLGAPPSFLLSFFFVC